MRFPAFAILFGLFSMGAAAGEQPPLADVHRMRLEEAFHLVEQLGPQVWPDFQTNSAAILLIDGESEYALGREQAPSGFEVVTDDRFLGRPVFARGRQYSPYLLATFPVEGVSTVVIGTAEQTGRSPAAWVLTVAHELFHVFQSTSGLNDKISALEIGPPDDPSWHLDFPFPYDDADVQRAMHLLGYNLFRAAVAQDPSSVSYDARTAHEALANLLVLLDLRYGEDRNANYLRYQTGKEGVARYVEYRIAEEAAHSGYRPRESFTRSEGAAAYQQVWDEEYGMKQLNQVKHAGSVSRSRLEFYGLGLGLALTLDRVNADWKHRYFEPGIWIDELLRDATGPESAQSCVR